ncbi:MAG: signal recognition particle-docking protein FtsY [Gammaproteobacteria bacterium]
MKSNANKASGFFGKLRQRLNGGTAWLGRDVREFLPGRGVNDDALLEELETCLLTADVGIEATTEIVETLQRQSRIENTRDGRDLLNVLENILLSLLAPLEQPLRAETTDGPFVILMVGVNGSGKTTTAAKIAKQFKDQGKQVILAAGDTFRAAAIEQLAHWGETHGIPVIAQKPGADPAAVMFDAHAAAKSRQADILVADTAGRLHNQDNLMKELKKIHRVLGKSDPAAPHEVLLVLDATNGQNALLQAKQFNDAINVTGIALTKLDGSARGGILFSIAKQLALPLRYIGIGEGVDDLGAFNAREFVTALLEPATSNPQGESL